MTLLLCGVLTVSSSAVAAQTWGPDDAVNEALRFHGIDKRTTSQQRHLQAQVDGRTLWAAPQLGLSHSHIGPEKEYGVGLQQRVDLSGWRSDLEKGGVLRGQALSARNDQLKVRIAATTRRSYFQVVYAVRRRQQFEHRVNVLQEGYITMEKRFSKGDVSTYALRRFGRALKTAEAALASARAQEESAWGALRTLAPFDTPPTLGAPLLPSRLQPETELNSPALEALRLENQALAAESEAWGSPSLRNWQVGAGYRRREEAGEEHNGFMVSLTVPLAVWSPDAPRKAQIESERELVQSQLDQASRRRDEVVRAASERLDSTLEALAKLPAAESEAETTQLAEAAYRGGEATLSEVLDAYTSESEFELARLDLEWQARLAAIDLDEAQGKGVPEQ